MPWADPEPEAAMELPLLPVMAARRVEMEKARSLSAGAIPAVATASLEARGEVL